MKSPIDKAREFAFAETGIQKPATLASFNELTNDQRKRINDSMAFYIIENPSQFGVNQITASRAIVSNPTFGRDLEPIETLTFSEAFGEQVKKTVSAGSDVVGKGVSGALTGLLGGNIITLAVIAGAGYLALKLMKTK